MPPSGDLDRARQLAAAVESRLDDVLTPALVIDLDAVDHNVAATVRRVGTAARWRPHIKTVKQSRIVQAVLRAGVHQLKCATLDELALALRVADGLGVAVDVMVAYPMSPPAVRGVVAIVAAHAGATVRIVADSPAHLRRLDAQLGALGRPAGLSVMLEVDTGMHRTGTPAATWADADLETTHAPVAGLHGYEGHLAWDERDAAAAGYAQLVALAKLPALADRVAVIVTSGTHAYHHALDHVGLARGSWAHQVSPGTIVLSDLRSAPAAEDIGLRQAAFVLARVVSTPAPDRVTLDAGSKGIAPDRPAPGCAVLGWPGLRPLTPSEEHLPLHVESGQAPTAGEALWLVPEHVCTTVNLYRTALYVRGSTWVGVGEVEASGRTQLVSALST